MQLTDDRIRTKLYPNREETPDCSSWISFHGELHPDTEPALISAQHRAEVADAVAEIHRSGSLATVALVASLTYLPAWNVKRAMDALGIVPDTAPGESGSGEPAYTESHLLSHIRKIIGPDTVTTTVIAAAVKLPIKTVRDFMLARPSAFQIHRTFRKPLQWSLIENFGSGKNPTRAGTARQAGAGARARARETKTIEKLRAAAARRKEAAAAA